jgi:hypothetical protein
MNASAEATTVITRMRIPATPAVVWQSLMFYEQIEERPPLLLRMVLPRPIRTHGSKSAVGDQATCLYEGGHLLKRVTEIDRHRLYAFSVIEQRLALGRRVVLTGGCYSLRELPDECTELAVTTRFLSRNRPRWLAKPVEIFVCHMFHRHLLAAIGRKSHAAAEPVRVGEGFDGTP